MPEWKDTVNLPRTDFPMKANLPTSEPQMLARWAAMDLYGKIRARRKGGRKFVLHDGPPYANGNIHMGTALNKILKDFVVKSKSMAGFDAPYVVGYDCHGLPIELKVDRELGPKKRDMTTAEFCRACRAYAERFIGTMTAQFQRLGVLGTWDEPYLTMDFRYQAAIARAFGRFVEQGLVYKGKKPVHWCIHCRTALAEAEVEYSNHVSPSIYVEFALNPTSAQELAARVPALAGKHVSVLIWTTTPWTIPSNLAIAFHPDFDYAAYEVDGRAVLIAEALAERVSSAVGKSFGSPIAQMKGRELEHLRFDHPCTRVRLSACSPSTSPSRPAPERCTRRLATEPTTSALACSTGSTFTHRWAPRAISSTRSSCLAACACSMPIQRSKKRCTHGDGCGIGNRSRTRTPTAGDVTTR